MKKNTFLAVVFISAAVLCIAAYAASTGACPGWLPVVAVMLAFPTSVLSLFLWWNASNTKGDIPFTGY
ncbi:MAG: hypothetical protein LUQ07_05495 [Methanospirillum sp.]|nr:hypothetical protein [Methanospirillum sp.]